jgi:hypothetical protein
VLVIWGVCVLAAAHRTGLRTVGDGHIQIEAERVSGVVGSVKKAETVHRLSVHHVEMQEAVMESKVHENTTFSSCSSAICMHEDTVEDSARQGSDSVVNIGENIVSESATNQSHNPSDRKGTYIHQNATRDSSHGMPKAELLAAERSQHIYQYFPSDDRSAAPNWSVAGSLVSELTARDSQRRAPSCRAFQHASSDVNDPKRTSQAGCPEKRPDGEIIPGVLVKMSGPAAFLSPCHIAI